MFISKLALFPALRGKKIIQVKHIEEDERQLFLLM
jgi:hypothetical protein